MVSLKTFVLLPALALSLAAQPGGVQPMKPPVASRPGGVSSAVPADTPASEARFLLVYPEGVYSPSGLQQMREAVQWLHDAVAAGARVPKAGAARSSARASVPWLQG